MKTKQGELIEVGTLLRSSRYPKTQTVICVGVTDRFVILKHNRPTERPWVMDQAQLSESFWVYAGMGEEK